LLSLYYKLQAENELKGQRDWRNFSIKTI